MGLSHDTVTYYLIVLLDLKSLWIEKLLNGNSYITSTRVHIYKCIYEMYSWTSVVNNSNSPNFLQECICDK